MGKRYWSWKEGNNTASGTFMNNLTCIYRED
jgi:hypothetical protein